jgi:hypothetical protein
MAKVICFLLCGFLFLLPSCAKNEPAAQVEKPTSIEGSVNSIRVGGAQGSKPGPTHPEVGVDVLVFQLDGNQVIARVQTNQKGHFEFHLNPGSYQVKTKGGAPPEDKEEKVVVNPGQLTKIDFTFFLNVP